MAPVTTPCKFSAFPGARHSTLNSYQLIGHTAAHYCPSQIHVKEFRMHMKKCDIKELDDGGTAVCYQLNISKL